MAANRTTETHFINISSYNDVIIENEISKPMFGDHETCHRLQGGGL